MVIQCRASNYMIAPSSPTSTFSTFSDSDEAKSPKSQSLYAVGSADAVFETDTEGDVK